VAVAVEAAEAAAGAAGAGAAADADAEVVACGVVAPAVFRGAHAAGCAKLDLSPELVDALIMAGFDGVGPANVFSPLGGGAAWVGEPPA